MFDSRVIVEHLDTLSPVGKLIPPAGRHRVRAVRADGVARTFTITIAPAKELSYGQIAW